MPQCNGEDFVAWSRVEGVDRRGCCPNAAAIGFLSTGQPDGAATGRNPRIPPALGASVKEICELFEISRLFNVEPPAGRQNAHPVSEQAQLFRPPVRRPEMLGGQRDVAFVGLEA